MAFRITSVEWIPRTEFTELPYRMSWLILQFSVFEEDQNLFLVDIMVTKGPETRTYEEREQQFKDALLHYAVRRIEEGLRSESFVTDPPERVQEIRMEMNELPLIEKLMEEKRCGYQINEGRNLFCSAGHPDDYNGTSLSQKRVPTSRPICLNCDLPGADYLCSNLIHPAVMSQGGMGAPFGRFVVRALCNRGEDGAEKAPSQCRPGGHQCWERIVELETEISEVPASPLALPEAFDYLDAVWRNVFGANHGLLHLTTVSGLAQLAQPCATLDEFESRLSVLSAVFKAMTVPDDLLLPKAQALKKDQTFDRIMACKRLKELNEADIQACDQAVKVLRTINKVRNVRQHPDKREFLRALTELGVPYPPSSWRDAWDRIRSKTIEALAIIRERIRMLS